MWHPLTVGQTLGPGNVIQTSVDSKVDIVFGGKIGEHLVPVPDKVALAYDGNVRDMVSYKAVAEQNVIRMESNTVLAIDKLSISNTGVDAVSDTELDLRQGTIFGSVKKLSARTQYVIKTPNGMAGVRGTTFIMSANGDITVVAGSMVAAHSSTADHHRGFGSRQTNTIPPPARSHISHRRNSRADMQTAVFIVNRGGRHHFVRE